MGHTDKQNEKRYHISKTYMDKPLSFGPISLIQLGRMHCAEQTVIDTHIHRNWFELTIVTDGKGQIFTNHQAVPISKGQIYLSFPGDIHRIETDRDSPLKFNFFSFYPEEPTLLSELEGIMQGCMAADQRILSDSRIQDLVANAIAETQSPGRFSDAILESTLSLIVYNLIRAFDAHPSKRQSSVGRKEELCYRVMNYIDTHLYTMEGLDELTREFCYNYTYLSARFHAVTGDTLQAYYRRKRLEAARLLLLENTLRVSEIAELLHYSSIYTFSRAFKEQYGVSPTKIREAK